MASDASPTFGHPALVTAAATVVAYGVVLLAMTAALFLVPYAIFTLL